MQIPYCRQSSNTHMVGPVVCCDWWNMYIITRTLDRVINYPSCKKVKIRVSVIRNVERLPAMPIYTSMKAFTFRPMVS